MKFENRDNAIVLSDQNIPVRPCAVIAELHNYKCDIFLGCFGALLTGVLWPITSYFMAKNNAALISKYETVRYDDGLKYCFVYLAFSILQLFQFFKL